MLSDAGQAELNIWQTKSLCFCLRVYNWFLMGHFHMYYRRQLEINTCSETAETTHASSFTLECGCLSAPNCWTVKHVQLERQAVGTQWGCLRRVIWDQFSAAPLMVKDKESGRGANSDRAVRGNYALRPVGEHSRTEEDVHELSYQVMGCLWPCTRAQRETPTGWSGWWSLQSVGCWAALRDTHTHSYYTQGQQFRSMMFSCLLLVPLLTQNKDRRKMYDRNQEMSEAGE